MVEILKQDIYSPLPFEKQVAIIFAGNEGYLDDIEIDQIKQYEEDLYRALEREKTILDELANSGGFSPELKEKLDAFLGDFAKLFTKKD